MSKYHIQLGHELLAAGLITPEQLEEGNVLLREKPYFRLGEVLVLLGHLSIERLDAFLNQKYAALRIGDLLLMRGYITEDQLQTAIDEQQKKWRLLGSIIVNMGFCSHDHVLDAIEDQQVLCPVEGDPALFD